MCVRLARRAFTATDRAFISVIEESKSKRELDDSIVLESEDVCMLFFGSESD